MQSVMVELWQNQVNFYQINLKMVNRGKKHRIFRLSNQEMICDMCLSAIKNEISFFFIFL